MRAEQNMSSVKNTRNDGRDAATLRPVKITPNYLPVAEGSVLIEVGKTRVACAATFEEGVPRWIKGSGQGWLTAEYSMLPRSTEKRTPREVNRGRPSGRTSEIQRLIGRALRSVLNMEALGERTFILDCDVIQADGGTRTASITGAYVALGLACKKLQTMGMLKKSPFNDSIAAVSVGIVGGEPMLDLDYGEDSRASVDMNVVMTGGGKFIELQSTAEGEPFSGEQLDQMLDLARTGIEQLIEIQSELLPAVPAAL